MKHIKEYTVLICLFLTACGDSLVVRTPQQVAEAFAEAYYQRDNVLEASALTTGQAKEKLASETPAAGEKSMKDEKKPRVSVEYGGIEDIDNENIKISYRVSTPNEGYIISHIYVRLVSDNEKSNWLVNQFQEENFFQP